MRTRMLVEMVYEGGPVLDNTGRAFTLHRSLLQWISHAASQQQDEGAASGRG